jgi:hypothetical protein
MQVVAQEDHTVLVEIMEEIAQLADLAAAADLVVVAHNHS